MGPSSRSSGDPWHGAAGADLAVNLPLKHLIFSIKDNDNLTDIRQQLNNSSHSETLTLATIHPENEISPFAGANLAVDVPWKYLNFFMEDDDKLADIGQRYSKGDETMLTGHIKKELITVRF